MLCVVEHARVDLTEVFFAVFFFSVPPFFMVARASLVRRYILGVDA
jgi:hypothetical protein